MRPPTSRRACQVAGWRSSGRCRSSAYKDRFRSVLMMKTPPKSRAAAVRAVGAAVQASAERGHKGVKFAVDVDPQ